MAFSVPQMGEQVLILLHTFSWTAIFSSARRTRQEVIGFISGSAMQSCSIFPCTLVKYSK